MIAEKAADVIVADAKRGKPGVLEPRQIEESLNLTRGAA
jgi:hypothetical protein